MELSTLQMLRTEEQDKTEKLQSLMPVGKRKLSKENQSWPVIGINKG